MFVIHSTQKGFIHIPRTAGVFIESQCTSIDSFESFRPYHRSIPEELLHYKWHTRMRDPVDRFVSLFRFNQNKSISHHEGDFDSFIEHVSMNFEWHTRPQVSFIQEFVNLHVKVENCIVALGGKITGVPINQSTAEIPIITKQQIAKIKEIYKEDVELFSKLTNFVIKG